MSLAEYRILSAENREVQDTNGGDEWVVVYEIPAENLAAERPNFSRSIDNVLPESSPSDPFPPHIHYSSISPVDSETYAVKCIYRRPTPGSLLRPGRGICHVESYTTTRIRVVETQSNVKFSPEVFKDESFEHKGDMTVIEVTDAKGNMSTAMRTLVLTYGANLARWGGSDDMSSDERRAADKRYQEEREQYRKLKETIINEEVEKFTEKFFPTVQVPEVSERLRLTVQTCDWWSEYFPLMKRAHAWEGTAGELKIRDYSTSFAKCSAVKVRLRPQDTTLVDSEYTFDIRNKQWPLEGVVPSVTLVVTRIGAKISVRQSPVNIETDVASALGADFTGLDEYFEWWPTSKQPVFRREHSGEIVSISII